MLRRPFSRPNKRCFVTRRLFLFVVVPARQCTVRFAGSPRKNYTRRTGRVRFPVADQFKFLRAIERIRARFEQVCRTRGNYNSTVITNSFVYIKNKNYIPAPVVCIVTVSLHVRVIEVCVNRVFKRNLYFSELFLLLFGDRLCGKHSARLQQKRLRRRPYEIWKSMD